MAQLPGPEDHRSPLPSPGQTRRQRGRPRLTRKFPSWHGPGASFSADGEWLCCWCPSGAAAVVRV